MHMPVVHIRKMRVLVCQRIMSMVVCVRLLAVPVGAVCVLVVFVVDVDMAVLHGLMGVFVIVSFR